MKDITFIAAYPKSGITYLNYMLFHILFDNPADKINIDKDYIIDIHENLSLVPDASISTYVKTHAAYAPALPLRARAKKAVYLVRDPIDAMMSAWDFKHLTGDDELLNAEDAKANSLLRRFIDRWIETGGDAFPFAGTWIGNVASWLDQSEIPILVVRYETLKANPREELTRILRFLEVDADEIRIDGAIDAGKVDNMRKEEAKEIASGTSGVFYRPFLSKGYSHGFRFVGKLHQNAFDTVLTADERERAERVFSPMQRRIEERSR